MSNNCIVERGRLVALARFSFRVSIVSPSWTKLKHKVDDVVGCFLTYVHSYYISMASPFMTDSMFSPHITSRTRQGRVLVPDSARIARIHQNRGFLLCVSG